ncbi:MAG: hypothetical protein IT176_04455 [Acidobacteria bacterium]|nr:hypothetical protein [Acidobacteriota bacterium]
MKNDGDARASRSAAALIAPAALTALGNACPAAARLINRPIATAASR